MSHVVRSMWMILAAGALVGCAESYSGSSNPGKMTDAAPTNTELAAYAGSHKFPTTQSDEEIRVGAIITKDHSEIKLYNFTNQSLSPVDIWVNKSFVIHLRGIAQNGSVIVKSSDLYNSLGKNFASQADPFSQVQIQTANGLFNAMGPQAE